MNFQFLALSKMKTISRLFQKFLYAILSAFHWKKKVLFSNLDYVCPEMKKAEKETFYNHLLKNISQDATDFIFRTQIYEKNNPYFQICPECLSTFEKMQKGGLMLTAHFKGYENLGPWLVRMSIPLVASYARIKPKFLENWVQSKLRSIDNQPYSQFIKNPRDIIRLLDNHQLFCFIADQDFRHPHFIHGTLMGKPVHCNPIPQFILRHRPSTPIFFCWLEEQNSQLWIHSKEIHAESGEDLYFQFHRWMEIQIKKSPEIWFGWTHRRYLSTKNSK